MIIGLMAGALPSGGASAGLGDALPPAAYLSPVDRRIAETGRGIPGRPFPCAREKPGAGGVVVVEFASTDRCVTMQPARRWRGLWRNDFEGSRFCPAPAVACAFGSGGDRIWLDAGPFRGAPGALYSIEFVGRRTIHKGPYGHLGVSDHEMMVDRVILITEAESPPAGN